MNCFGPFRQLEVLEYSLMTVWEMEHGLLKLEEMSESQLAHMLFDKWGKEDPEGMQLAQGHRPEG